MRAEDRERAVEDVVTRVMSRVLERGPQALEAAIADTLYHEKQRVDRGPRGKERDRRLALLDRRRGRLLAGSDEERRRLLREVAEAFAREVLGNFDPRVHAFATRAVPFGLAALLHASSPRQLLRRFPVLGLEDRLAVQGEVAHARALKDLGTIVCVPTHSSNLDSIVLGYGMHELGFPPLLYGAGLNLFENPLISYFMHNLGAYKVDRRKTAPLYRDVLKEYATVSLEYGYHNLFFPGGTRARSGAIEDRLKLGLLGTSLRAFANNLRHGRPRPRLFVVPVVLSYELVLEAETLVDDFLRETGKSRYIITDDEFASPRRILQFMKGILELDARIAFTFMPPLDPFGNRVDEAGVSLDGRGRPIDIDRYLRGPTGELVDDDERDHEYTRELGERLVDTFHRGNTLMPTHLVSFAFFEELRRRNPGLDLYRLLRTGGTQDTLSLGELSRVVAALRDRLVALEAEGRLRLDDRLRRERADDLVLMALRALGTYHTRPALARAGDRICSRDRNLLYFYRNRLLGYGLEAA
ncbi:MAG: 1-acyl-sn-glycerol-3-phosphate acyltransferase [Planctomycetota bacterium]|nr:1-acyl-sn-glycerol-3-phosphate acyltransferase [Planctomycetota bacterium]